MAVATLETPTEQLDKQRKEVSYDSYDMAVRQLIDMFASREIDIAPDYQRRFVWNAERESELIESIYLGIPVPSLYMASNKDGSWEVVDGVQRLSTLVHFCGAADDIKRVGRPTPLILSGLKKLNKINNCSFESLPRPMQIQFGLRSLRVTTLNDKSNVDVRYDLFERLNTGGVMLHDQEIRNCVFRGPFLDAIKLLADNENFRLAVKISESEQQSAIREECVLRYFAFLAKYTDFGHSVVGFLNEYAKNHRGTPPSDASILEFEEAMAWIAATLPQGIIWERVPTPLNLYEAVAVGATLARRAKPELSGASLQSIMGSDKLKAMIQKGGTNSRKRVVERIDFVRDQLLGG